MNKKIFQPVHLCRITILVSLIAMVSCKKYDYLGFTPGTGTPTISSVHTYLKTDTTTRYDTLYSYDAAGNLVTALREKQDSPYPFDSVTTSGNLGGYYVIYGTNLGNATSITFNGYPAYFNRALITDKSIVVQVPAKTPYFGSLATDSLVVHTLNGRAHFMFKILSPPPTVASYSNYNFSPSLASASQITLQGVGFVNVTAATLKGPGGVTGTTTIVSQNDSVLTLKFDATAATRGVLEFTYNDGGTPRTISATQELVNLDNTEPIFLDDPGPGWGSWSWGPSGTSTAQVKTGTASYATLFGGNSWWVNGFRNGGGGAGDGIVYSADYRFLSFWVHGGTADQTAYIEFGNEGFSNSNVNNVGNPFTIPAGKWTYIKIPIADLKWNTTATGWSAHSSERLNTVAFFMYQNTSDQQLYIDDLVLIK
ncbi:MAG TPA: hypothetical protein PKC39_06750 [Ferruginibacter sp.]|nr:hypothetical protein [Ferruginibacter sp.]HMP20638.1 hypothetical protein [Ferruginibacter sp.]